MIQKLKRPWIFGEFYNLKQFNTTLNCNKRTLDLDFSNFTSKAVLDIAPLLPLDNNHVGLYIELQLDQPIRNMYLNTED